MVGSPFVLGIKVYDIDSVLKADVEVVVWNHSTSESQKAYTNAQGEVLFNLANFVSGWTVGEVIAYYCLYLGYEASGSFIATDIGGTTKTLYLVEKEIVAPSLRYFTIREFLDNYSLKTYEEDNENGIKTDMIMRLGNSIETQIDELLRQRFDSNSGSYSSVSNEYHNVDYGFLFHLKKLPVVSISKIEVNPQPVGSESDWIDIAYVQLDNCDAITDWSAGTDGEISLNTTNDKFNEGTGCLNITKSGATTASVLYSKTISAAKDFTNKRFRLDFYCADTDELASSGTAVQIRIGSDSSNYYYFNFTKNEIYESNWTTLSLQYNESDSDAGTTGTPTSSSCDYIAVQVTYAAATTTVTAGDMRLDNFRFNEDYYTKIKNSFGRVEIVDGEFPELGKDQIRFTYTYGFSSVPNDIKRLAILMVGKALNINSFSRLATTTVEEANGLRIAFSEQNKEIDTIIENRRICEVFDV